MRKVLLSLCAVFVLVLISSCTLLGPSDPFAGVWQSRNYDSGTVSKYIFTADGHYAYESYCDDKLEFADFGLYSYDDLNIYLNGDKLSYSMFEKTLTIEDDIYVRNSRSARYSTSSMRLKGVWKNSENLLGFSNGYVVVMGTNIGLKQYSDNGEQIVINDNSYDCAVINSKLYVRDGKGFFGNSWGTVIFEHLTTAGTDQTSREILVGASPWQLIDTSGSVISVYTFNNAGNYVIEEYRNGSTNATVYQGTFSLSGNHIKLSNNADLDYAIIDQIPFMFTI